MALRCSTARSSPKLSSTPLRYERLGDGKWAVHGDLTVHGQTRQVKVDVEGQNGHYRGTAELKQKDFGITPVSVGGGAVKVKNELRIEFEVFAK